MRKPTPNWVTQTAAQHGYPATDYSWHRYRYIPIPNKNVVAPEDGVVTDVTLSAGACGKRIQFKGSRTKATYYMCHFEHVRAGIKVGQKLSEGQLLGIMGQTGQAYGPHLHLVILINGQRVSDPDRWLNEKIAAWKAAQAKPVMYTVKKGDTVSAICAKYGITLAKFKSLNPKITNVNLIYPGQVVRVK